MKPWFPVTNHDAHIGSSDVSLRRHTNVSTRSLAARDSARDVCAIAPSSTP